MRSTISDLVSSWPRGRALTVHIIIAIASVCAPLVARAQDTALETEFRPLLVARYAAIARGDTAALSSHFADDLRWIGIANAGEGLSKAQLLALTSQAQVPIPVFDVDSIRARRFGNAAIVEYRRSDHRRVGDAAFTTVVRSQEVFSRSNGKWLLKLHTQSWVVTPITPVALDSATLVAFVGHYQIAPGYVDNVHWENGQLVATATGQATGARLVPVSATAFSPDGVGVVMVFERDSVGHVLDYVQAYPDGRVVRARRLP